MISKCVVFTNPEDESEQITIIKSSHLNWYLLLYEDAHGVVNHDSIHKDNLLDIVPVRIIEEINQL